jgi:nitrous oxidase accessory protein NosD
MVCHPDSRGPYAAADILQDCINRAPAYSSIEIPPGVYVLHRQVVVATPLTIRTAGSAGTSLSCAANATRCAVLVAAPDFLAMWGPLVVWSTNNVALEHLVIDGNRAARAASAAAGFCVTRGNTFGFNASVVYCQDCSLDDVVSAHALCGTGMVWSGARATIQHSAFMSNGEAAHSMWSDGLTLLYAPESVIRDNQFVDNSDVALLIAYGVQSRVEHNVIVQRTQRSFAGLMLHNFGWNLRTDGDFRGAVIAGNTVDCGAQLCAFGIQVGPRPWNMKGIIVGGDIHDNAVRGAKVGINVDGAGMFSAPVAIYDNRVTPAAAGSYFSACPTPLSADWMNVAPDSVIDRRDETTRAGSHLSDWCQLWSDLSTAD